ncbi:MAG: hypothetical protein HKN91_08495 [Acidimicrobiia bacterium]|nr:hypothetical protein [Acidimicrobiia bacterium]
MRSNHRQARVQIIVALAVWAIGSFPQPSDAQWVQEDKITVVGGMPGDALGRHAALSGGVLIATAPMAEGPPAPRAYLFQVADGLQLHELTIEVEEEFEELHSVDIDGHHAVLGTVVDPDSAVNGAVYVFDVMEGQELARITHRDVAGLMPYSDFGVDLDLAEESLVVGAPFDAEGRTGAAYVFDATGRMVHRLTVPEAECDDRVGFSVAADRGIALIGAPHDDDACPANPDCESGAAYVFDLASGLLLLKLTASDVAPGDRFGWDVAMSGRIGIVGATGNDEMGSNSGAVYAFDLVTGEQLFKLTANDGAEGDRFGTGVAMSGSVAVIQARFKTYIFDVVSRIQLFGIEESLSYDSFDIDGDRVIVGASDVDDLRGAIYVFERTCFDLTGDASVGPADLAGLLEAWGPCEACPADVTRDGTVDFGDLLGLLSWWGPCPQPGACCLPGGTCVPAKMTGGLDCVEQSGTYQGDDSVCDDVRCE